MPREIKGVRYFFGLIQAQFGHSYGAKAIERINVEQKVYDCIIVGAGPGQSQSPLIIRKFYQMRNIKQIKQVFWLLILFVSLFLSGCPAGDKVIFPRIVKGASDIFEVEPVNKRDQIEYVVLSELPSGDVVWKIVVTDSVLVDGFHVQIGVIPENFKQLVPEEDLSFIPEVSKKYLISIITDNSNERYFYASTIWTKSKDRELKVRQKN